jgi:hypothetical protein
MEKIPNAVAVMPNALAVQTVATGTTGGKIVFPTFFILFLSSPFPFLFSFHAFHIYLIATVV